MKKIKKKKKKAKRIAGLTYNIEKKLLIKIAKRLPLFFTPDRLTLVALLAAFFTGLSYYLTNFSRWWLLVASAFIILNWFGDSLDGTVARVRKITRERYGYYVDHILDMVAVFFILFGLGLSQGMNMLWALALILLYYLVSINTFLAAYTQGKFKFAFGKIGPTEVRLILIITNIIFFFLNFQFLNIGGTVFALWDIFAIIAICMLIYGFLAGFFENLRYLDKIDKKTYKEMSVEEALRKNQFIKSLKETDVGKFLTQRI